MCWSLKLLVLSVSLFDIGFAERRLTNRVASIRGGVPAMSLGAVGTASTKNQLRIDSKSRARKEEPAAEGADNGETATDTSEESVFKAFENPKPLYIGVACLIAIVLGIGLYFCICRKKSEEADTKEGTASQASMPAADDETIALSDSLLRELVCRSLQRVGPALAKGQALQNTVERAIETLTGKAQQLLMSELNCAAGSICQTLDAEEAMLILDWDAAVRANFPAVSVLLAGTLAPTLLQINLIGHLAIVVLLLLPVFMLCAWAAWMDHGIPCPAIPTIFMWLYVQGILALVLCLARILMVWQIRSGQAQLQQKAAEFQEQRGKGKKVIATMGELQNLFVSHSVLVQHALLIEESVANSALNKIVGASTFAWIIVTLWGTVLVLGWTFVPGVVAFHADAAKSVDASDFCGAWATVFVARLVVIIGILFFLVNTVSAISWGCNLALGTPWVQGKARHWAQTFDAKFQGLPVMQVLFKAFLLPRELDTASAELAAQLHEQTLMEEEHAACEQKLKEIRNQLDAQRTKTAKLCKQASRDGDKNQLEEKLAILEKRSRSAMDSGEWKKQGAGAIEAAKANALIVEQASTEELERVFNRIREAADQIQNSEVTKEMLQKAQDAADQLQKSEMTQEMLQKAQAAAEAGKEKLRELSETEQGQQVRAAVSKAGSSAAAAAERTAAVAKEQASKAQEKIKEQAAKEGKK